MSHDDCKSQKCGNWLNVEFSEVLKGQNEQVHNKISVRSGREDKVMAPNIGNAAATIPGGATPTPAANQPAAPGTVVPTATGTQNVTTSPVTTPYNVPAAVNTLRNPGPLTPQFGVSEFLTNIGNYLQTGQVAAANFGEMLYKNAQATGQLDQLGLFELQRFHSNMQHATELQKSIFDMRKRQIETWATVR